MTEQDKLAADVARTIQRIQSIILALQERHRDQLNLSIHLVYNWKIDMLLKKAKETNP